MAHVDATGIIANTTAKVTTAVAVAIVAVTTSIVRLNVAMIPIAIGALVNVAV